ncbi:MAG TPA: enoyl-CoA hydratase-related protein [Nitrososphaeraceae archaeon]|nr:enoyl-CoA hydratase-related protein [Nitrososphaeraceae archaeon]
MKNIILDLQTDIDIAIIKMNRPEVLNALNKEIMTELSQALDIVSTDDGIKVIVITGTGERSFCAGADIRYVVNVDPIEAERYATFVHTLLNKIENLQKPVIAAINGYALGGGCELALACDIRIASSNAKIGQTEVTIGIPPGWGGTQRLLRIVGPAKAKELIYTGKMITAEEAERIGLANKVVSLTAEEEGRVPSSADSITVSGTSTIVSNNPSKEGQQEKQRSKELAKMLNKKLLDECLSFAKEITKNSFIAVKTSKMLINKGIDVDIDTGLRLEIYGWALCFAHEDRQKMMSSFLNKGKQQKKD